jgi:hypothetical protein
MESKDVFQYHLDLYLIKKNKLVVRHNIEIPSLLNVRSFFDDDGTDDWPLTIFVT